MALRDLFDEAGVPRSERARRAERLRRDVSTSVVDSLFPDRGRRSRGKTAGDKRAPPGGRSEQMSEARRVERVRTIVDGRHSRRGRWDAALRGCGNPGRVIHRRWRLSTPLPGLSTARGGLIHSSGRANDRQTRRINAPVSCVCAVHECGFSRPRNLHDAAWIIKRRRPRCRTRAGEPRVLAQALAVPRPARRGPQGATD